jgi:nitrite reductase (NADH) large subunit
MVIAIIGSGIAAKTAAETLLSAAGAGDKVIIISRDTTPFYSRVLLADYISADMNREELMLAGHDLTDGSRIQLVVGRVIGLDTERKSISIENAESRRYDRLIIASGASAQGLEKGNAELSGIHFLRDIEDADAIKREAPRAGSCAVIGGGLVSLKAACALARLGKKVTVIVGSDRLLSRLADSVASAIVRETLEGEGITFRFMTDVTGFAGDVGRVAKVLLRDGSAVEADLVVLAKGVRPNLDFVKDSGIAVDRGILVDDRMRTTAQDVFAAGDVAQAADILNGGTGLFTLWPDAAVQGRVAASNAMGREKRYTGGMSMNSVVFYGVPFVFLGIVKERELEGCEVHTSRTAPRSYRKIVTRRNRLVGAVLAGNIDHAGMLYWDIRSGCRVDDPRAYLTAEGLAGLLNARSAQ